MDYERVNWENLPSTKTPVNADNLNKMDKGIAEIYGKVEHKIFKKTVTTSGWSTPLQSEDYKGYDFITFYITSSDFKNIITLPIDVLKLRITDNAYMITSNNKQYMAVGMYSASIMLYKGYADSIEIILWK